jgi:cell division GTPase FtsZ
MRILLIGIGGAGCRIADALTDQDLRSHSIRCIDGIAVDRDAEDLNSLRAIPQENRIFYQLLDPLHTGEPAGILPHDEIVSRLHTLNPGDIDAFIVIAGLGGEMATLIPDLVTHIREGMVEPVFGLFTLPCKRDGEIVLARAANNIDDLVPVLDGILLYDNEIWYERGKVEAVQEVPDSGEREFRLPLFRPVTTGVKIPAGYRGINMLIGRQIGLLLRAGEASEYPGSEVAEVALDAGEVLNTIRGMGFVALGYEREHLPAVNPDLITRLRPVSHSVQESHLKASRIVTMAKKAVTEGLSVSCHISEAEKALVLIAGPTNELSMRGYMTIRHWIDRSIRGQEVRSGDYPLSTTQYIVVMVILSGFKHFTRLDELREIRDRVQLIEKNG